MPLSNELVLGWRLVEGAQRLSAETGIQVGIPDIETIDNPYDLRDLFEPLSEAMESDLRAVHKSLLEKKFGPVKPGPNSLRDYHWTETPEGDRTFAPFNLTTYVDPDEAGDGPEDYSIGVALAARYFPVWIDWREKHGTSGTFRMDVETLAMIEEARAALAAKWPSFAEAEIIVKTVFY